MAKTSRRRCAQGIINHPPASTYDNERRYLTCTYKHTYVCTYILYIQNADIQNARSLQFGYIVRLSQRTAVSLARMSLFIKFAYKFYITRKFDLLLRRRNDFPPLKITCWVQPAGIVQNIKNDRGLMNNHLYSSLWQNSFFCLKI